ncbi:MAG TPA: hypothetical protein VGJ92_03055 [Methanocella sp.]
MMGTVYNIDNDAVYRRCHFAVIVRIELWENTQKHAERATGSSPVSVARAGASGMPVWRLPGNYFIP